MTFSKNLVIWPVAAVLAIAAGSAAIATAGGGPNVLTGQQASERLAQARASSVAPDPLGTLAADEWYGSLPSAGVVARCASGAMQLVRWIGPGLQDLRQGPAATVSGAVSIDDDRVTFTGRCVDGRPTGTYRWAPIGTHRDDPEPPQRMMFGKWVDSGIKACTAGTNDPAAVDPAPCRVEVPLMMLSVAPGR